MGATKYSPVITEKLCELIATSSRGLRSICAELNISTYTVMKWLSDEDKRDFTIQYARAKELQADYLAEEIIEISDDKTNDDIITDNGTIPNNEWINRSRLKVDSRKWIASKLAPKKYGDKMEIDLNNKIIQVIVEPEED